MLSLPHLVVLFVMALVIFGPQKLPELARMLGKATAEFRKMTNDFRYALEDEVRELERQTRIREEEIAAAARAAQMPAARAFAGSGRRGAARDAGCGCVRACRRACSAEPQNEAAASPACRFRLRRSRRAEAVSVPHEKSSDDNAAV